MLVQTPKNSYQGRDCRGLTDHTFAVMYLQRREFAEFNQINPYYCLWLPELLL